MNITITGGCGFIGKSLSNVLIKENHNVTILDNLNELTHGNKTDILKWIDSNKINVVVENILNVEKFYKVLRNTEVLIHLASDIGTAQSMYEISNYTNNNIQSTSVLLEWFLKNKTDHNLKKIILASSRSVYGEGSYMCNKHGKTFPNKLTPKNKWDFLCPECNNILIPTQITENDLCDPHSIYALTKHTQEELSKIISNTLDIQLVILRLFNVYGAGQSLNNQYTGIFSTFMSRIKNNLPILVFEDGIQSRDFIYIDDVVNAFVLSLKSTDKEMILNVGSGIPITVLKVAETLKDTLNSNVDINLTNKHREGDIRHSISDNKLAKKLIGFEPQFDFKDGLKRFVEWSETQSVPNNIFNQTMDELTKYNLFK